MGPADRLRRPTAVRPLFIAATGLAGAVLLTGCAGTAAESDAPTTSATSADANVEPTPMAPATDDRADGGAFDSPGSVSPPSSPPSTASRRGTAAATVTALSVKGRAPQTGYSREQFGQAWADVDRNGCDTRNDVLGEQLTDLSMSGTCKVLAGTLADPYTNTSVRFAYGGESEVDIDHVVALSDAWQKGAQRWPFAKRVAFANDPMNLQATTAEVNRAKGDGDAATWLPPARGYWCGYIARQAGVKSKYGLWVTQAEQDAMLRILQTCPDQRTPDYGTQPTIASNTGGAPPPTGANADAQGPADPVGTAAGGGTASEQGSTDPRFSTCGAANSAGFGPYVNGRDAEYSWYRDADRDGTVCES